MEEIKQRKYSNYTCKCGRTNSLSKIKGRKAYACNCGRQVFPLSGTIFEHSRIPLTSWFYCLYRFSQTKNGLPAAQIQRELGCTYTSAHRLGHKIRELMADDTPPLKGQIEADETYMRAKPWRKTYTTRPPMTLMAMTERGGRVKVVHIDKASAASIKETINQHVEKGSVLHTDGSYLYRKWASESYTHDSQVHWRASNERGGKYDFIANSVPNTQYIEGFFSQMKPRFTGVYRSCSPKYLQAYANEYAWRYSNRKSSTPLFYLLLDRL